MTEYVINSVQIIISLTNMINEGKILNFIVFCIFIFLFIYSLFNILIYNKYY